MEDLLHVTVYGIQVHIFIAGGKLPKFLLGEWFKKIVLKQRNQTLICNFYATRRWVNLSSVVLIPNLMNTQLGDVGSEKIHTHARKIQAASRNLLTSFKQVVVGREGAKFRIYPSPNW